MWPRKPKRPEVQLSETPRGASAPPSVCSSTYTSGFRWRCLARSSTPRPITRLRTPRPVNEIGRKRMRGGRRDVSNEGRYQQRSSTLAADRRALTPRALVATLVGLVLLLWPCSSSCEAPSQGPLLGRKVHPASMPLLALGNLCSASVVLTTSPPCSDRAFLPLSGALSRVRRTKYRSL